MEAGQKKREPRTWRGSELKEREGVYFLFIHEGAQLLKLLRRDALGQERHYVFNPILKCFQRVERVANYIELAVGYPVRIEDCRVGMSAIVFLNT